VLDENADEAVAMLAVDAAVETFDLDDAHEANEALEHALEATLFVSLPEPSPASHASLGPGESFRWSIVPLVGSSGLCGSSPLLAVPPGSTCAASPAASPALRTPSGETPAGSSRGASKVQPLYVRDASVVIDVKLRR
jgi:hypothetical protein